MNKGTKEEPIQTSSGGARRLSSQTLPRSPPSPSEHVPDATLNPQPAHLPAPQLQVRAKGHQVKSNCPRQWVTPRGKVAAVGALNFQQRKESRDYFPGAEQAHAVRRCCSSPGFRLAATGSDIPSLTSCSEQGVADIMFAMALYFTFPDLNIPAPGCTEILLAEHP